MAKFCTKCGRKLEEGEVCECTKEKKEKGLKEEKKEETIEKKEVTSLANDWLETYIAMTKGILEKPITTIKKYAKKENAILSWIILGINSFFTVLFLYLFVKETTSNVSGFPFNDFTYSGYSMDFETVLKIFLTIMVGYASMAGLLTFIGGILWKKEVNFNQIISVLAIPSTFTILTTLLSILLIYLSTKLMGIVLLISLILYLSNIYHGWMSTTTVDENKISYSYTGALVLTLFVVTVLMPKLLF